MKFPVKKEKYIKNFFFDYTSHLNEALKLIDLKNLERASNLIEKTIKNKKNIFVCGNGGSAAISNHFVCDYLKLLRTKTNLKPKVHSFSTNIELVTAISNDISYDEIFTYQAKCLCESGDLIILISSSGNSQNIKSLINYSKKNNVKTVGLCGFEGGYLKKKCDISLHVKSKNYGISEDSHHIIMHIIMQYLRQKFLTGKINKINF